MASRKRPTIVVLGGLNMDLIGITPRLPAPGETVRGEKFYTAPGGKGGNQAVAAACSAADILTPNQSEAEALPGIRVDDLSSAQAAARELLDQGVGTAVVKLGERGVYYHASDGAAAHVPAFKVQVVDTVAAGDAFGGALAVALSQGKNLGQAMRYGAAAGALAVTRPGAQEAMPERGEVEALLDRG